MHNFFLGYRLQVTGYRLQVTGYRLQLGEVTGIRKIYSSRIHNCNGRFSNETKLI
ncbi:hypothetical protein LPB90_19485 [Chryseobacterium sp. LC2016-29]|uniref:hypothetical protein n=1 Tax=Chryseobacterium sp. LC2016-29 TaxID=2897331 RepID=UPI001E441B65|nr:hypothetical protein [Chryseobacterium sp. LC2016-29]MCD0480631.1 hypothetical protein [Chryseobacterium sp. LC2016-29]